VTPIYFAWLATAADVDHLRLANRRVPKAIPLDPILFQCRSFNRRRFAAPLRPSRSNSGEGAGPKKRGAANDTIEEWLKDPPNAGFHDWAIFRGASKNTFAPWLHCRNSGAAGPPGRETRA
jgi:hypothetical protein